MSYRLNPFTKRLEKTSVGGEGGVPSGGSINQALVKNSTSDYDTTWKTINDESIPIVATYSGLLSSADTQDEANDILDSHGAWDTSGHTKGTSFKQYLVDNDLIVIFDSEDNYKPKCISAKDLATFIEFTTFTFNFLLESGDFLMLESNHYLLLEN